MTSQDEHTVSALPFQVEAYLDDVLDTLIHQMQGKERRLPEEHLYWLTTELRCPRPRGMSRDDLISCLEQHLCQRLEEANFRHVYINGVSNAKTYHIRWESAAAHEETDHD